MNRITNRTGWIAALLWLLWAASAEAVELRVVTYNIHHGESTRGVINLERIAAIIKAENPDVVCLQEVDRNMERTHGLDMPQIFSDLLRMKVVFDPNLRRGAGEYGNATLTNHEILHFENIRLPGAPGAERRGCLKTTILIGGVEVDVYNTHLGLKPDERKAQAATLVERLGPRPKRPSILAGDLNETADAAGLMLLLGVFQDSFSKIAGEVRATIPSGKPATRIDFVLATRDLEAISAKVIATPDTAEASDHLPYTATFKVTAP